MSIFSDSNFFNFLRGGTRGSELRDTKRTWQRSERTWRRSTLSKVDAQDLAEQMSSDAVRGLPAMLASAIVEASAAVLRMEAVGELEPNWRAIEESVDLAVQLRDVLSHREQWAAHASEYLREVGAAVGDAWKGVLRTLPPVPHETGGMIQVPLIEFMVKPAEAVEALVKLPFNPRWVSRRLGRDLRTVMARNLTLASGLREFDANRVILPTKSKLSGKELVDAYLRGTPFAPFFGLPVSLGIPDKVRFEHCHIIGGTGHGKTQLLQKLIHADLVAGDKRSVIVVDSQGDLIQKLLHLDIVDPAHPRSIANRLVVVDPADMELPFSLNLFARKKRLDKYGPADRERVLNGVIELYELFFSSFLGAELTARQGVMFKYLARLMMEIPDATIFTLIEIMEHGKSFKGYMDNLDGAARHFFEREFFDPSFIATKKQILKRLWAVLATPAFERMFLQRKGFDIFEAMQDGKIILVNTAKDILKRDGSALLGRFFIGMIAQAALERSTIKEVERTPTYLYVDEAHEYFDDSIETILTQARKYKVGITLAHQSLDQLDTRLRSAIFANTSTKCVGGVSVKDANVLADELRTNADFLTSMRRAQNATQFALWVKQLTEHAITMTVPLGFLERMPTTSSDVLDAVLLKNRESYGGQRIALSLPKPEPQEEVRPKPTPQAPIPAPFQVVPTPRIVAPPEAVPAPSEPARPKREPTTPTRAAGKGGQKHTYLQSLIKELAEQYGMKAVVEAAMPNNVGQVDVLVSRDDVVVAFQVSVTTPAAYEAESIKKCLAHYPKAVLVASNKRSLPNMKSLTLSELPDGDHNRVSFLFPEELPDYIAALAPPAEPEERIVKGYKVRTSSAKLSPEEVKQRRDAVAALIAKSMRK